ncbi:MAG: hypothetical protein WD851_07180 [Pirellulales bacterium]
MSRVVIGKLIAGLEVILSFVTYLPMSSLEPDRIQESRNPPVAADAMAEQEQMVIEVVEFRSPLE